MSNPKLDERFVEVTSNTEIIAVVKKSEQQIQNELKKRQVNMEPEINANDAGGIKLYYSENVSIDEITIGSHITIYADENIKYKKNFVAQEISFIK